MGDLEAKPRKDWVDALRGIAMIMVVLGHSLSGHIDYFSVTSPIKMPLFFAISAFLFKDSSSILIIIRKLLGRIVMPWLCLGGIIVICIALVQNNSIYESYYSLIMGEGVWWFLPCFFWGSIFHAIITSKPLNSFC